MKGSLHFQNRLEDTNMFTNSELRPLLKSALKKMSLTPVNISATEAPYWRDSFFELDRLALFRSLPQDLQGAVLMNCNRDVLEEAFYIEKSGMAYAAKMSLLADSIDERSLYALFCADEASHLHAVSMFMRDTPESPRKQPFLQVLDDLVHHASFNSLVYIVQIILEGWGLHHYLGLASGCQNPALTEVLRGIIQDEAKHHGSGLVILPKKIWTAEDGAICFEILRAFLNLVRVGPINLLGAFERVIGPLPTATRESFYEEWGGAKRVSTTLGTLRPLIFEHSLDPNLLAMLDAEGLLGPAPRQDFLAFRSWSGT